MTFLTRIFSAARSRVSLAVRVLPFLVLGFLGTACDSGGGPNDEAPALNPDDIQISFQAVTGTTRDEMKATMTSNSTDAIDMVNITVLFNDESNTQIGQMPFVFLGEFRQGDRAEQQLGLPASIEKHNRYSCYRYRVILTGEGEPGDKVYSGTCN